MQVFHYESIDSTQNQAKRLIDSAEIKSPSYIVAEEQSAGRGQYGKSWASPKGAGLYVSFVMAEGSGLVAEGLEEFVQTYTQEVAVKLIQALNDFYKADYYIKPINDIYYDGAKLAGILVEIYKGYVIIGIGLNLKDQTRQIKEALVEKPKAPPISLEQIVPVDRLNEFDSENFIQSFFIRLTEA